MRKARVSTQSVMLAVMAAIGKANIDGRSTIMLSEEIVVAEVTSLSRAMKGARIWLPISQAVQCVAAAFGASQQFIEIDVESHEGDEGPMTAEAGRGNG